MGAFAACTSDDSIHIYAAASIAPVAQHILRHQQEPPIRFNVASSSVLARQIEAGAPADLYLSASPVWTAYLEERHTTPINRWNRLHNTLVLITNRNKPSPCLLNGSENIAMADWTHVPAGMYAREALQKNGLFERLQPKLLPTLDVHAVLTYVSRGDVPCGIVYQSDTLLSDDVKQVPSVLDTTPIDILYSFFLLSNEDDATSVFQTLITKDDDYQKFGFSLRPDVP